MKQFGGLVLAALPISAAAEVMDKEPSAAFLISIALSFGVAVCLCARYRPWLLLVLLPYPAFLAFSVYQELEDASVGPAIRAEAPAYVAATVSACLAFGVLALAGVIWRLIARERSRVEA
jgi:hypothetical protein